MPDPAIDYSLKMQSFGSPIAKLQMIQVKIIDFFLFFSSGIAQNAFDTAIDYSLKRQSFGSPIAKLQMIQAKVPFIYYVTFVGGRGCQKATTFAYFQYLKHAYSELSNKHAANFILF